MLAINRLLLIEPIHVEADKKGGLAPSVGWYLPSNPNMIGATNTQFGLRCIPNMSIQTQQYGYRATRTGRM